MSIQEQLQEIKENGLRELENFADAKELDSIRVRYLGKKGELTAILKQMGKLSPEERPVVGQLANEVRQALEAAVAASQEKLKEKESWPPASRKNPWTLPFPASAPPSAACIRFRSSRTTLIDIFQSMGFDIVDGPESRPTTTALKP